MPACACRDMQSVWGVHVICRSIVSDHSYMHGPWHYSAGPPLIPMTAKPHSGTLSDISSELPDFFGGAALSGELIEGVC